MQSPWNTAQAACRGCDVELPHASPLSGAIVARKPHAWLDKLGSRVRVCAPGKSIAF